MYCKKCGAECAEAAKFCTACGVSLEPPAENAGVVTEEAGQRREFEAMRAYVDAQEARSEHYLLGFLGALGGAIVGAIPWAIMGALGWIVGWLGYLIAILASKGYDLFKVRPNIKKLWCVVAAVIVGVFLGQVLGDLLYLAFSEELRGMFSYAAAYYFEHFGEMLAANAVNLILGYVFAALGAWGVFREVKKEHAAYREMKHRLGQSDE